LLRGIRLSRKKIPIIRGTNRWSLRRCLGGVSSSKKEMQENKVQEEEEGGGILFPKVVKARFMGGACIFGRNELGKVLWKGNVI